MSMRNFGCHGHVIEAGQLAQLLPKEIQERFNKAVEAEDWELCQTITEEYLDESYPMPECFFVLNSEDESEDLEHGTVYVMWMEESLFERKETREMRALKSLNIVPTLRNWVKWG